ncbi:protein crumbs-like [Daphnia carinata]|uniref:protein crumbs-like n=1 Tax=Daphnia carinata TaxID=120202 RepID=UPI00257F55BD|nr:protein crumbs-like [Daphnia carinata]
MSPSLLGWITAILLIIFLSESVRATCDSNRLRQGCRIQEGSCLCGTGCDTDYRYSNKRECESALRGRSQDPCSSRPCNRGSCLQILNSPNGYNCLCSGTNYFGDRCEQRCPRRSSLRAGERLPIQCIVV